MFIILNKEGWKNEFIFKRVPVWVALVNLKKNDGLVWKHICILCAKLALLVMKNFGKYRVMKNLEYYFNEQQIIIFRKGLSIWPSCTHWNWHPAAHGYTSECAACEKNRSAWRVHGPSQFTHLKSSLCFLFVSVRGSTSSRDTGRVILNFKSSTRILFPFKECATNYHFCIQLFNLLYSRI